MRRACNNNTPVIWSNIFAAAEELRKAYGHTLPKSEARLRDKLRQYTKEGYACLVSGKFCNANTLKITKAAGRQIVALRRCRVGLYDQAALRRIQPHRRTSRLETARFAVVAGAIPRTAGDQAAVVRRCLW